MLEIQRVHSSQRPSHGAVALPQPFGCAVHGHATPTRCQSLVERRPALSSAGFRVLGLSHRTAPSELRSRVAVPRDDLEAFLWELSALGCSEVAVVSTCNRTEVYFTGAQSDDILRKLAHRAGMDVESLRPFVYLKNCVCAACHLFRVTSGLDSAVLGETEVVAQVKEAWRIASEAGTCRQSLDLVFQRALEASKRVRTDTELARCSTSSASLAVRAAQERAGDLEAASLLIVGAGKIAVRLAKDLPQGRQTVVLSRTMASAAALADRLAGRAGTLEQLEDALGAADAVFFAASVPEPLVDARVLARVMEARQGRPLVAIDLGLPANIGSEAIADGFHRVSLEDLQSASQANSAQREAQIPAALEILDEELARFGQSLTERAAAPTIKALLKHGDAVRRSNVEWATERLGNLSPRELRVVDELARRMVIGLLQPPIETLKDGLSAKEHRHIVEQLFRLETERAGG